MEGVSLSYALGLPPKDAISYLESKGAQITFDWKEVWQNAQAKAFTVAGVARLDVLEDIRGALKTALAEGKTQKWFAQQLEPVLRAKGWWGKRVESGPYDQKGGKSRVVKMGSPARLNLIYRQNMQTAYMAGRYKQMLENADNRPWWRYVAVLDQRTRPAHRLLNGRTFRFDDAFWSSHYPPNGWGCRCRVQALSDVGLEREGQVVELGQDRMVTRNVELVDRRTGEASLRQVTGYKTGTALDAPTIWTDPGFSYNPGQAAYGLDMEAARRLSLVTDTGLRAQAVQALNGNPARQQAWENFARGVLDTRHGGTNQAQGQAQVVHFMRGEVAQAVRELGGEPVQVVTASARRILHAGSPRHVAAGSAPARAELLRLPALMDEATAVLWDANHANLIYVCPSDTPGKVLKIMVNTPTRAKDAKGLAKLGRFDALVNVMEVVEADIRPVGDSPYRLLWSPI
ncbi:MAG: phage head morphogenesis protein [Deltaproteobacteria bacterium HGW-Deltaproteobacteria-8]|jgi:SPP1 gp7 family putative phage head morphogenesis protein|nr:MAG: phage head morphogenesis protein [Deltaproteobacteria bacterium HGW-Deltaproteobacteria-8]